MLKRYCLVFELKEEHVDDYIKIHKNPWPEILSVEKAAGIKEELIWNYKNLSIVYIECEDIEKVFKILADNEVEKKWDLKVSSWFKEEAPEDHSGKMPILEKIFDLNQQLKGKLEDF